MADSASGEAPAPTLSVVTPSFNFERFLSETLDSVAALQTPHEHIVIDGGSTDGTVELLDSREDPALTWISEADRGQTHAVNKGLRRARGRYVGWLNADDAYVSEEVDRAVALLEDNPRVDAVFGFMDVVDEEGRVARRYRCGRFNWTRYLYSGEYLPTPTIIFRRSLLERAPQLDEGYVDAADYDFYLRLLRGAKVQNTRRPLVRFRYHDASKTASSPDVQRREGLAIRLSHARSRLERAPLRLVSRALDWRRSGRSTWPELPHRS
jgi:glycosyltransferase involved in cell wall biosynthesis